VLSNASELCCCAVTISYKDYKLNHATVHQRIRPHTGMLSALNLVNFVTQLRQTSEVCDMVLHLMCPFVLLCEGSP